MDTLTVKMQTIDEKTMFSATARENPEIIKKIIWRDTDG